MCINRTMATHLQLFVGMRRRSFASALMALAACEKLAASPGAEQESTAQCSRDEECMLVPSALSCCAECPPAPPFEAAPTWVIDGMYIENENRCLATEISCGEIDCPVIPAGCSAQPVCLEGRCVAVTTGCAIPTS
jgi:hypothetical protein